MMNLPDDIAYRWLTYDREATEAWLQMLSPEERRRAASYTLAKRRREFVLGRAAARTLLAGRLGVAPAEVPLQVAEDGGVDVLHAEVAVSISHSGRHAVAAAAGRAVGVDLERIAPRHPDLPGFLLHPHEHDAFDRLPLEETRRTVLFWTLKEAALKALRTGFRLSPKKLRLDVELDAQAATIHVDDGRRLQACFEEREACYLAVAFSPLDRQASVASGPAAARYGPVDVSR